MSVLDAELSNRLIDDLSTQRYCVLPGALPKQLVERLRQRALERNDFRAARVGRSANSDDTIRNDEIAWIDEHDLNPAEHQLFEMLEDLRGDLNRTLFLGLVDFEAHYARYEAGHFYRAHVDRFARGAGPSRAISVVIYLNESWTESDGGELRLHVRPIVDVLPLGGTIACFTSDDVEHEVLPSRRERLSIAAWFRQP